MKTYYVNCYTDKETNQSMVGLFDASNFEGRGNFCGWYGVELYTNTNVLAYYPFNDTSPVNFKNNPGSVVVKTRHYDEIAIGSVYWQKTIEAVSDEEAIEKFKNLDF